MPVDRLADGSVVSFLDGRVRAQRVFAQAPLLEGPGQQDFPAAAPASSDGGSGAWLVYVNHEARGPEMLPALTERPKSFDEYLPGGGGDQVRLLHYGFKGGLGQPGTPIDVTEPGRDVWRPAVATAGDGSVLVVWTEKRDDNWDLFARRYDPKTSSFAPEQRLTDSPGPDTDGVLATASDGTIWMAWQSWSNGQADILLVPIGGNGRSSVRAPQDQRDAGQRMGAEHRRRQERSHPRCLRQLPGGKPRRRAADPRARRHAQPRRSRWRVRPRSR